MVIVPPRELEVLLFPTAYILAKQLYRGNSNTDLRTNSKHQHTCSYEA